MEPLLAVDWLAKRIATMPTLSVQGANQLLGHADTNVTTHIYGVSQLMCPPEMPANIARSAVHRFNLIFRNLASSSTHSDVAFTIRPVVLRRLCCADVKVWTLPCTAFYCILRLMAGLTPPRTTTLHM